MRTWHIAWKDTLIRLRDRNALLLTIVAPLIISAIMGFAFSNQQSTPVSDIPVVVVNQDSGPYGKQVAAAFEVPELAELLAVTPMSDLAAAKKTVEEGNARAVVYIPAGFSDAVAASNTTDNGAQSATLQLFTDPSARITPSIIETIARQIAIRLGAVSMTPSLVVRAVSELAKPEAPADLNQVVAQLVTAPDMSRYSAISIRSTVQGSTRNTNPFAFFAPSLAVFFLLFSMLEGPRSIFAEQANGTFARLLSTPATIRNVLFGKFLGTLLSGCIQFIILVIASRLLFGMDWGHSPLGLALMVISFIAAAAGIGAVITAFSRDNAQAALLGGVIPILFGALGGNFFSLDALPGWLQTISYASINRWAVTGFSDMTVRQQGFNDILLESGVLGGIAVVCFFLAAWRLPRRFTR
jgi:ABC-2 type transport system permease protein